MADDMFAEPVLFPSGVRWEPDGYLPIDQTPYRDYLERNEAEVRKLQEEMK